MDVKVGAPEVGGPADEAEEVDEGGGWMVGVVRLVVDGASSPSKVFRPPRVARDPDPPFPSVNYNISNWN